MTIVDQQQQQLQYSNNDKKKLITAPHKWSKLMKATCRLTGTIMPGRLSIWMAIHPEVVVVTIGEVEF
jgi:hypothetical protein